MSLGTWWSESEDHILINHYAKEGTAVAARLPGRTKDAAKKRANKLGLQAPRTIAGLMPKPHSREEQEERMPIHTLTPAGQWRIDHPITAPSVFSLGVAA